MCQNRAPRKYNNRRLRLTPSSVAPLDHISNVFRQHRGEARYAEQWKIPVKRKAVIHQRNDGKKRDEFIGIHNLLTDTRHLQLLGTRPPWRAKVIARLEKDKLNVFHKRL